MIRFVLLFISCLCAVSSYSQTARTYDVQVEHNKIINGRPHIMVHYKINVKGAKGHTVVPVLFVDREKGVAHYWKNGQQMKMDGCDYGVTYDDTYWEGDNWFNISNQDLNPMAGNHEYNIRILIFDRTLGQWLSTDAEWVSYTMTGTPQFTPGIGGRLVDNTYINGVFIPQTVTPINPGNDYDRHKAQCGGCGGIGRCSHCIGGVTNGGYKCSLCNGTGTCQSCHGTGYIRGNF